MHAIYARPRLRHQAPLQQRSGDNPLLGLPPEINLVLRRPPTQQARQIIPCRRGRRGRRGHGRKGIGVKQLLRFDIIDIRLCGIPSI